MLGLSIWKGFLEEIANVVGIAYPPNALFLVAFGFVLILLLHFSLAVSRLSDQSKVLAQRLALVEQRLGDTEERLTRSRRRIQAADQLEAVDELEPLAETRE